MEKIISWVQNATQSMFDSQHFTSTLLFLAISVIFTMIMSRQAKTQFVKKAASFLIIVVLAILTAGTYNIVLLFSEASYNWIFCIIAEFIFLVFALGGVVVTGQDMTYENGVILIRRKSFVYKLLVNWGCLNLHYERTLCELSWIGAAAIIFLPLLVLILVPICISILLIAMLFSFVILGMDPIRFCKETIANPGMPQDLYLGTIKGIPISPFLWSIVAWVIWWGYYLSATYFTVGLIVGILALLAVSTLLLLLLMYMDGKKRLTREFVPLKEINPKRAINESALATTTTRVANAILSPFQIAYEVFCALKGDFCPPVQIVKD